LYLRSDSIQFGVILSHDEIIWSVFAHKVLGNTDVVNHFGIGFLVISNEVVEFIVSQECIKL